MGLSDSITLSFMIVGHTKFSPDSCFGLLKQSFRKTHVQTLQEMADVTSSAACNEVELVGLEDGIPIISKYDWSTYFAPHFNKIPKIKQYHHFTTHKSIPGKVQCKVDTTSPTKEFSLLKSELWDLLLETMPSIIQPKGLEPTRQWYLYEKIRPFCHNDVAKDRTCLLPLCMRPCGSAPGSPAPNHLEISPTYEQSATLESPPSSPKAPPTKKQRLCSNCFKPGHNSRTCSNQ